ncbi:hypothetical protein [Paraprevotella xylaniphila]|uniref:hypothetical protein n=1 Tax=Paraprevotella xylaniphila TaxID=454155 RepID=UPI0010328311|nr:hypothetical protein [Paraprevotella xylaniphila]
MNTSLLSLTEKQEYAVRNILQSMENAKTYCSYLDKEDLRWELEEMIEEFIHNVEDKINDNY